MCPVQPGSGQSSDEFAALKAALWLGSLAHGEKGGSSLTFAFLSSPRGSEGDSVRVRSLQPGAHQMMKQAQPAPVSCTA